MRNSPSFCLPKNMYDIYKDEFQSASRARRSKSTNSIHLRHPSRSWSSMCHVLRQVKCNSVHEFKEWLTLWLDRVIPWVPDVRALTPQEVKWFHLRRRIGRICSWQPLQLKLCPKFLRKGTVARCHASGMQTSYPVAIYDFFWWGGGVGVREDWIRDWLRRTGCQSCIQSSFIPTIVNSDWHESVPYFHGRELT